MTTTMMMMTMQPRTDPSKLRTVYIALAGQPAGQSPVFERFALGCIGVRSVPDRSFPILIEIGAHSDGSEIEKSRFPF